jgi:hypothetical protein
VGVHLTTKVGGVDVELGLVEVANDLNVGGGLHELHALDSASGNEACATTWFCTPGDHLSFLVGYELVWLGWAP